jgi:hypothetical protein
MLHSKRNTGSVSLMLSCTGSIASAALKTAARAVVLPQPAALRATAALGACTAQCGVSGLYEMPHLCGVSSLYETFKKIAAILWQDTAALVSA